MRCGDRAAVEIFFDDQAAVARNQQRINDTVGAAADASGEPGELFRVKVCGLWRG
jgi:hypothetical protein